MARWVGYVTESTQGWRGTQSFAIVSAASDKFANQRFDPFCFVCFFRSGRCNCEMAFGERRRSTAAELAGSTTSHWNTLDLRFHFTLLYPDTPIGVITSAGPSNLLLLKPPQPVRVQDVVRMKVEVCYCSLLEDCWHASTHGGSRPGTCKPEPKVKFRHH